MKSIEIRATIFLTFTDSSTSVDATLNAQFFLLLFYWRYSLWRNAQNHQFQFIFIAATTTTTTTC